MDRTNHKPRYVLSLSPEEIGAIYEKSRRAFSKEDLAPYLEAGSGMTFTELMTELDQVIQVAKKQSPAS